MSVERIEVSKTAAAHRRAAELVTRAGRLERQLGAYFAEITEVAAALRAEGSEWVGPILPAMLEAAGRIWAASVEGPADLEAELELARLGEIPLMRLEPDAGALAPRPELDANGNPIRAAARRSPDETGYGA